MNDQDQLHRDILDCLPHLRAFAHLLARDRTLAEDLVQDTVVRALTYHHQFEPGTNFRGWLIIILRNRYFNEMRRRNRKSEIGTSAEMEEKAMSGGQEEHLEVRDFKRAFQQLPDQQREALLLVGANGFSYEEAAGIARCAVGTMKSRVSRARLHLQEMLESDDLPKLQEDEHQQKPFIKNLDRQKKEPSREGPNHAGASQLLHKEGR